MHSFTQTKQPQTTLLSSFVFYHIIIYSSIFDYYFVVLIYLQSNLYKNLSKPPRSFSAALKDF